MQIDTSTIPEKNMYHETFKMYCFLGDPQSKSKPEMVELMLIHVGLIHNALGLAFMEIVKAYACLSNKIEELRGRNKEEQTKIVKIEEEISVISNKNAEKIVPLKKPEPVLPNRIKSPKERISIIVEKPEEYDASEKRLKNEQNQIVNDKSAPKKEFSQTQSNFLSVNKLAERIQKNNKKTSKEKITKILKSTKKQAPDSVKSSEDQEIENPLNISVSSENGVPLAYTKNFKKKKADDISQNLPLKKIKEEANECATSTHNSKKQAFRSKRRFLINQKENENMQLTQSLKDPEIAELLTGGPPQTKNKPNNIESNNNNENNESNPFRQNYRKKEEREKLKGFACDQCEKFYKALGRGLSLDPKGLCKCTSRHKDAFEITHTPEAFYEEEIIKFEQEPKEKKSG